MERVTFTQVDSTEEICKVFNGIIANQNQIEGKLLQLIASNKKLASKSWVGKLLDPKKAAKPKEKGFTMFKTMLVTAIVAILLLAGTANAVFKPNDINYDIASNPEVLSRYLKDVFANQIGNTFVFTPTTQPSSTDVTAGMVYFDSVQTSLFVSEDGSTFVPIDTAGGVSLDGAYDFGGAGSGRTITVDSSAVALTTTDAANNVALAITQADTAGAVAQTITSAGTGALLSFDSNGTGVDLLGSDSTWTVTKAGLATVVGITVGASDITLELGGVINNTTNNEIEFIENGEEFSFAFSGNTLTYATDTGIDTISFGVVDELEAVESITFNAGETGLITLVSDSAADDLTISQTGSADGSVVITSAGTAANAIDINATAGGIDIDISGATAGEDFAVNTDSSVQLTSSEAVTDAIKLNASAGGFDIDGTTVACAITNLSTGTDDNLTVELTGATASSLILSSAGTGTDAVDINATAGSIDMDAVTGITMDISGAAAGEDFTIVTDSSIVLTSSEDATDAIDINASAGGIDIDATGEAGQDIIITNTGGSVRLVSTESAVDSIVIQSTLGGIDILCDAASATEDIDIANTGGSVNINSSEAADAAINISTSNAAGQIQITSTDTTADGIEIDSVGGIDVDVSAGGMTVDLAGASNDFRLDSAAGSVLVIGAEAAADAVVIDAENAAGGIDMDCGTNGFDLTATGGDITLQNTSTKDIILDASAGRVLITGTESAADAIILTADGANGEISLNAAIGGIDLNATAGPITLDTTGAAGDVITLTNASGTGVGAIALTSTAGGITAKVADEKELKIGNAALDAYFIVAASATPGNEDVRIVNTSGTAVGSIEVTSTAGGIDMNAKEMFTVDLASGTAGTTDIILTNTPGTDEAAIAILAIAGGIDMNASTGKNIALNGGQILIEAEDNVASAVALTTNTGTSETIVLTNTLGEAAGSIDFVATAGGITAKVADEKELKIGNAALDAYFIVAASGTAGNEDVRVVNGVGTAVGAIEITSTSGGIDINAKEMLTLDVAAGTAGTTDIIITNTPGTDAAAIYLNAVAGGMKLHVVDEKSLIMGHIGDDTVVKVSPSATPATEFITIVNAAGTSVTEDSGAIQLSATAGGIQIQSDANLDDAVVIRADGGTTAEILIHNDRGDTATSIELVSDAGGVTIGVAKLLTMGGGTVHSSIQDVPGGQTTTPLVLTNTVFTVGADAGGDVMTIVDGTAGQIIYIICEDATGTSTITPDNFSGGTSITFDALGDTVILLFTTDGKWNAMGGNSFSLI